MVRSEREVVLPLDAYMIPGEDVPALYRAVSEMERRCLADLGIIEPRSLTTIIPPVSNRELKYLDEETAKRYGYRQPYDFTPYEDEEYRKPGKSASQEEQLAMGGGTASVNGKPVPQGGCRNWAAAQIETPALELDPRELEAETNNQVLTDRRFKKAHDLWVSCMSERFGYSYAHPTDPETVERWGQAGISEKRRHPLTQKEIQTALHDIECRERSKVYTVWLQVSIAWQKQAIEKNETRLVQSKRVLDRWMQNARAVTG